MVKNSLILLFLFIIVNSNVFAQEFIDINANVMEMNEDKKVIVFTGEVVAKKQDIILYSDKLTVYYLENKNKKKDVDTMIAEGKVKIVQLDKVALGDIAKYFRKEDMILLEGKPAIVKDSEGNEIKGDKVIFYIKENKSVVEGSRPKVIFKIGD